MGPGIFTRRAKAVICGVSLVILAFAAAAVYGYFRSPISGMSPYETVNDLYDWEYMAFTAGRAVYPAETETVELTFCNNAPDGVVALASHAASQWCLEVRKNDAWRGLRLTGPEPCWRFREEDCTESSTPSGIVDWGGGKLIFYCDLSRFYPSPLEPGRYRIVIPDCEHMGDVADLAAEFEVE